MFLWGWIRLGRWMPGSLAASYPSSRTIRVRNYLLVLALILSTCLLTDCVGTFPFKTTGSEGGIVSGRLHAWTPDTPIANRNVTLCRTIGDYTEGNCELMDTAVESDDRGRFKIENVPEGIYFVLYDSGLSDFNDALQKWGGRSLHFGDRDWLIEFLGANPDDGWVTYRLPEGIIPTPHEGWLSHYCGLTLLIGYSPFIIAHDMELARDQRQLNCFLVEVKPGETSQIDISVTFFGN